MFVLVFEVTVVFVSPQFESAGGQEGEKKRHRRWEEHFNGAVAYSRGWNRRGVKIRKTSDRQRGRNPRRTG